MLCIGPSSLSESLRPIGSGVSRYFVGLDNCSNFWLDGAMKDIKRPYGLTSSVMPIEPVEHQAEVLFSYQRVFRSEYSMTRPWQPNELHFFAVAL